MNTLPLTLTLTDVIIRFRADWAAYSARCDEIENGATGHVETPRFISAARDLLDDWSKPAETEDEAILALDLACEEAEIGPSERTGTLVRAAYGFFKARREAARTSEALHGILDRMSAA